MKKYGILVILTLLLALTACGKINVDNQGGEPPIGGANDTLVNGVPATSPELVEGNIDNIDLDLGKTYPYLDSVALEDKEDTLGDILSAFPNTIIYFYPADFTPNCTIQALDFSRMKGDFEALGYQIIGVSKNDMSSHREFAEAESLTIKLLEDREGTLLWEAGALSEPREFGAGPDVLSDIIRTTIIVDQDGTAKHAFYDVEATGHAQRILDLIKAEQAQ